MGCPSSSSDDDSQTSLVRLCGVTRKIMRRAMCGHDLVITCNSKFSTYISGCFDRWPIGIAAHENSYPGNVFGFHILFKVAGNLTQSPPQRRMQFQILQGTVEEMAEHA